MIDNRPYINLSQLNGNQRREIWAAIQAHDPALKTLLDGMKEAKNMFDGQIEIPRERYEALLKQWRRR